MANGTLFVRKNQNLAAHNKSAFYEVVARYNVKSIDHFKYIFSFVPVTSYISTTKPIQI
jgi:hypothetical protein